MRQVFSNPLLVSVLVMREEQKVNERGVRLYRASADMLRALSETTKAHDLALDEQAFVLNDVVSHIVREQLRTHDNTRGVSDDK